MNNSAGSHGISDASLQDLTLNELVHLIRKLRWMGLNDEAARLEAGLARASRTGSVLEEPIVHAGNWGQWMHAPKANVS
jgi:hypothetical protein